jgi:predicted lipid-binding transport protein (Tim44 family)
MAADLIIYGIIAAALVFWLKNILGTRNGEEREHQNPFAPRNDNVPSTEKPGIDMAGPALNLPLIPTGPDPLKITKTTLANRVRIETPGVETNLRTLVARAPSFNLERFLEGAEYAFELIVTSFAKGDRTTLKTLLAPSVYNDFDRAITDRAARGETVETKIEAVRAMDVIECRLTGNMAYIGVRFTAQEICIIRGASGAIISGGPEHISTMIDIWTFGRDITQSNPTWFLFETRDEHTEAHKTPLPESHL